MHTIGLPATSKHVPVRNYIDSILYCKQNPDVTIKHGLTTWWPVTGAEVLREFRKSIHDRINSKAGESWRNNQTIEEIEEMRDSRLANTPRLIIRKFTTPRLNERLAHRLYTEEF